VAAFVPAVDESANGADPVFDAAVAATTDGLASDDPKKLELAVSKHAAQLHPSSVDVGFAQDMSVHHRQAVTMASWARDHTSDPAVRQLAFDVETGQTEQIGRMQSWLMLWDQASQPPGTNMAWMAGASGHEHATSPIPADGVSVMPGMATQQEIAVLRSLSGRELDVYFLQLMLRHHGGGAPMARYASEQTRSNAVRSLANSIVASQTDEMGVLRHMLEQRGTRPLP
jgi:uncharacterized protein (DUF305 family)